MVNVHRVLVDNRGFATKNPDHILLPTSEIVDMEDGEEKVRYEAIGRIEHRGTE